MGQGHGEAGDAALASRRTSPTMREVAARAGVSQQLASMVFRNVPGPSEASRSRVLAAAAEVGYVPHTAARVLRQTRSMYLGVLFNLKQPWEADLVEALYPIVRDHGYQLVLGAITADRNATQVLSDLLGNRSEAVIVTTSTSDPTQLTHLSDQVPVVQIGRHHPGGGIDVVRVANKRGARLAVDHLVELGHRSIAHLDGGKRSGAAERMAGYQDAMRRQGLVGEVRVLNGDYSEESGLDAARYLLSSPTMPTAVFAANDTSALGLVIGLLRGGIRIPEDVSVVGFDDSRVARPSFLNLTTVKQEPGELAKLAVDLVLERIEDARSDQRVVVTDPTLVVRGSTAPPGRDRPGRA